MALSEQEIIRREKLQSLRNLGINPYPANLFPVTHTSKQVKETFEDGKTVTVAGRLMSVRDQGKACFAELQDSEGRIQLYLNRDLYRKWMSTEKCMMRLTMLNYATVCVM